MQHPADKQKGHSDTAKQPPKDKDSGAADHAAGQKDQRLSSSGPSVEVHSQNDGGDEGFNESQLDTA